jgi:hypothetical protein
MVWQIVVLLSPIWVGQRGGTQYFKIEPSILGSLHSFIFLCDGPIKLVHCEKKKKQQNWEAPHLINKIGE